MHFPEEIYSLYNIYECRHASVILKYDFPEQYNDITKNLLSFRIEHRHVISGGGNQSEIVKGFSTNLKTSGWREDCLQVKTINDDVIRKIKSHKIDFIKGKVAMELEWNSKDQTFDRDLTTFKKFHEQKKISLGIIITRGKCLTNELQQFVGGKKFSASTTWIDKLKTRIDADGHGTCPLIVFAMKKELLINGPVQRDNSINFKNQTIDLNGGKPEGVRALFGQQSPVVSPGLCDGGKHDESVFVQ